MFLLPQDRVQTFSTMTDVAQLEDSINAIEPELSVKHQKLKEFTEETCNFESLKIKIEELIAKLESEVEQLKLIVDQFKERREREARKGLLAQKKIFLLYDVEMREFEALRQREEERFGKGSIS